VAHKFGKLMFGLVLKTLNSSTSIGMISYFDGQEVMHQTVMPEVLGLIPNSGKDFIFAFLFVMSFIFAMLIHKVHLTCGVK